MNKVNRHIKRVAIGVAGGVVLAVGVIAIPYPGPGWLIVFAGLGILATEFEWASRLLRYGRGKYDAWGEWIKRQHLAVRIGFIVATTLVVIATIYLLNGYGLIDDWLHLGQGWLHSRLFE